ncbi:MAG: flagellar biosynthesis protein FlhB [Phycisphaeraceae bacterium]|nr:flagellar biosynthesis protein FlhB [Phycisphaeraceae bacterium]
MAENDADRTESATPRRRQEAREEGNVARSTDLSAAASLLASVLLLHAFGFKILTAMQVTLRAMLGGDWTLHLTRPTDLVAMPYLAGYLFAVALAPLILGIMAAGVAATVGQVGFIVTTKPLELDLTKLSPLRGLKNLMGARGAGRLLMSIAKVFAIAATAYFLVHSLLPQIVRLAELELMPCLGVVADMVYGVAIKLALLLLVLAILDFAYQRWQHDVDLRMTKQEVKDELKRMEGDPMIKQRRARVARQLAMSRLKQTVPKADVIVTNPTHFAVALQYESKTMAAPKVIAKGADHMALRIRQLGLEHGVPLVERRELARGLFYGVEVGQQIPPNYYSAVAEILAYVYRLGGRKAG